VSFMYSVFMKQPVAALGFTTSVLKLYGNSIRKMRKGYKQNLRVGNRNLFNRLGILHHCILDQQCLIFAEDHMFHL